MHMLTGRFAGVMRNGAIPKRHSELPQSTMASSDAKGRHAAKHIPTAKALLKAPPANRSQRKRDAFAPQGRCCADDGHNPAMKSIPAALPQYVWNLCL